ncbi:MAG: aminotransferase class III-fold pyridoxal phosphate-dependent enzyme [Lentisphaeraceae bacterium]|nr:aminotransferase class III-fold pyridoxal phosphate-dependent enzyme [Lentisphaeraceae bacterium]
MSKGQTLWRRAVNAIPGGNGLLSKRPDRYAPDIWPCYYSKAKGVYVWDLDDNRYIDMAQMGIGTAILGYSDQDVNQAVIDATNNGVNTTLNSPEEVYLAEKLLELNPFAGGVRFARSGGEAMSIAVRIARASAKRDKIAFSGYHGWSDWYLATNLSDKGKLNEHLLPGLSPKGVPRGLEDTALPFSYNDGEDLLRVLNSHRDIGVIVIEGARYDFPSSEFLMLIQEEAKKRDIIVILDEITSGWRMTDGGVYKLNGFNPDIVVYGKAMGNGFAISAVLGKSEIMDMAQETFISSTFWTERVGFAAALATIEKLTKNKVWEHLINIGTLIGDSWQRLGHKHGLSLSVTDYKPLITMKFNYGKLNSAITTLFIQEMLKRGYLASTSIYISYAHTEEIVEKYFESINEVFSIISLALENNTLLDLLETSLKDDGFKRLN